MRQDGPSITAWSAAAHRAAHQLLEDGRIFDDPFAVAVVGGVEADILAHAEANATRGPMRIFIAVRHRVAEDEVDAAYLRGVRQVVVLGAGFDTFACRNAYPGLRVWEVDHPATQAVKLETLQAQGIPIPDSAQFVAVDFEVDDLAERLAAMGFDRLMPAVFLWLGVVPYLTREAVEQTLRYIASVPASSVVFDHPEPVSSLTDRQRRWHERRAAAVGRVGEPWITAFAPADLADLLAEMGMRVVDDVDAREIAIRWFGAPASTPPRPGGHVVTARAEYGVEPAADQEASVSAVPPRLEGP
ncbi:class I SAM-dependent methyltransferase [Microbacterium sp. ASV49]|uniref:S-adenosyl-L-methionine-dependent methyltransferase n=1 Tax=Microbacterium candidum TaxID=3041922 RepID=A0ABT7MX47_9MICO|nr:SAM-dependent methyltransferase [Microbacterium sp. ASV49]MDL9979028.1 SAM-dependent methyltransferase [Microbacterium sp. ASV49]